MTTKIITFSCDAPMTPSFLSERSFYERSEEIAALQEELEGRLVGLARGLYADEAFADTHKEMIGGLFASIPTEPFFPDFIKMTLEQVKEAKLLLTPHCAMCGACSRTHDYSMKIMLKNDANTRSFKTLLLFGLQGLSYYCYRLMALGYEDKTTNDFFYKGMFAIGEDWSEEEYMPLLQELITLCSRCLSSLQTIYGQKKKPLPLEEAKTTFFWYDPKDIFLFFALLQNGEKHFSFGELPSYLSTEVLSKLLECYSLSLLS